MLGVPAALWSKQEEDLAAEPSQILVEQAPGLPNILKREMKKGLAPPQK
jgi:hypothetical protein